MKPGINRFLFPGMGGPTSGTVANAVVAPPAITASLLSQTVAGALAAATYFVKTTWVNAQGETLPSNEVSLAVLINNVLHVATPLLPPAAATGWNVYVSTTTGTETKQNGGTPIAIGTAWVEPTTGLVAGAALPGSNTAVFTPVGVRMQVLITVTQNTWVTVDPSAPAASGTGLLVTPSTPIETVVPPGYRISYVQDTAAGQISIVQISG